jgi:hypothetical protein
MGWHYSFELERIWKEAIVTWATAVFRHRDAAGCWTVRPEPHLPLKKEISFISKLLVPASNACVYVGVMSTFRRFRGRPGCLLPAGTVSHTTFTALLTRTLVIRSFHSLLLRLTRLYTLSTQRISRISSFLILSARVLLVILLNTFISVEMYVGKEVTKS